MKFILRFLFATIVIILLISSILLAEKWIQYTITEKIYSIAEDEDYIWACSDNGIIRLNRNVDSTVFYNVSNSLLPDNRTISIAVDEDGYKWVGTMNGLVIFTLDDWTVLNTTNSVLQTNVISDVATDKNGNLCIATSGAGLLVYDGSNWYTFSSNNSIIPDDFINMAAYDSLGHLWIASFGLLEYDNKNWLIYNTSNSVLPDNFILSFAAGKNNKKWIGTESFGIVCFDGLKWLTYNKSNSSIPDDRIRAIAIDSSNNVWIGTKNGLAFFDEKTWKIYDITNSKLPSNTINDIFVDSKNNIWIGTSKGIAVLLADETPVEENNPKSQEQILLNILPNPFTDDTEISFNLAESGIAKITISDLLGNEISVLKNEYIDSGQHTIKLNPLDFKISSGIYFCTIHVNGNSETKKMIKLIEN